MDESDDILVRRCQAGDKSAFGVLVRRYAGRATTSASLLLGCDHEALDASQDAFVRAWRGIRRLRNAASFPGWFARILRNVCLTRLRRRARHKTVRYEYDTVPSGEVGPSELAERDEQSRRLRQAIRDLPAHQRDILLMNHFHRMTYKDMAEELSVPIGTVMSRLHYARKALRDALAEDAP